MGSKGSYLRHSNGRNRERTLALLASFAFHIVLGLALIAVSPIFTRREKIPEIYTVRLFFPEEGKTHKKATQPKASTKKKQKQKKAISVPKRQKKRTPPKKRARNKKKTTRKKATKRPKRVKKKKVISTRPKKVKKERKKKKVDEEKLLRERLARIREKVKERESEAYLRKRLKQIEKKVATTTYKERITARSSGKGAPGEDALLKRYFARVWEIIRSKWILPQGVIDKNGLEAVMDITISKDGRIIVKHFEKRSGEPLFDQSVERAMDRVDRLPPLPRELGLDQLDIGVRFRPEE